MKDAKKLTPIQRLMAAMDRCALTRSDASWTQGYRTGAVGIAAAENDRLYAKAQAQFEINGRAENNFRRLAQRLLREARQSTPSKSRRRS